MKSLSQKTLLLSFCVLVIALALNGVVSYRATLQMIENERWVSHTHQVLAQLAKVHALLTEAETSQRGFLITGSRLYLEPYEVSVASLGEHLRSLHELTADNPAQRERLAELEPTVQARLQSLERGIELRRSGWEAAQGHIASGTGKRLMDQVGSIISAMTRSEEELLVERSLQSKKSGRSAILTLTVANALLLVLVVLAFNLIRRDLIRRLQAEEALRRAHDELEGKVQARTAELKDANERLTISTLDLERSNRELQDFAFVASHDLQEPLRKIQAFGDRLKSKHGAALGDEGRDYLDRMQAAARRMHTLINDLLTFSRVTSKAQPFVPVDLEQVTHEVLSDLEIRVNEAGGRVEVGDLPTLEADPLQMRQLLQNLLGNALKFRRDGVPPVVRLSAAEAGGNGSGPACRLVVEDNGIGFDVKYLDRIFTPFQRLHGRSEYEGTGMGLAVCRRIVERHGGAITAESTPGEGTRFLVTLPMQSRKL